MQEKEDFRQLYLRQADMVYRLCLLYLKNSADTEDAVQNIFLKAWEKQISFKDAAHEKAWFITVARNYCKDVLKCSWRKKRTDLQEIIAFEENTQNRSEKDDAVLEAVMKLTAKYREVLYLYYFEEYAVKEISKILHRKESTIQSQLAAARKNLKKF